MEKEIFTYLDNTIEPVKDNFLRCKKSTSDDEKYQFVCGGIQGLLRLKFKNLSPKQIQEFHVEYVKARGIMWATKTNFLSKLFGGLK